MELESFHAKLITIRQQRSNVNRLECPLQGTQTCDPKTGLQTKLYAMDNLSIEITFTTFQ